MANTGTSNVGAADVKRLRELTGSGMMDCKKALQETGGDVEQAVELLREKSAKSVDKRAERTTANGLVAASGGVMIELNSETDFVAKSPDFQRLADAILAVAVEQQPADVDALRTATLDGGTVTDAVAALSGRIGEKLQLKRYARVSEPVMVYLHRRATDLPPAIGTLVSYAGEDVETVRGVAMHIAAAQPRFTTRDEVPADVLDAQRREAEETAKDEGKPAEIVPRIVEGKIKKFYSDSVLFEQVSVLDDSKKTVKVLLDEAGVTVKEFVRFEVGQA